jgi:nitrite reductase/ring-hydroxylating ferredoxin subunit
MSAPFESKCQKEIIEMLEAEGTTFRSFECISEGAYAPQDAAWNYMDIPHLQYVHKQVEGCLTLAGDAVTASVFFQNIPFARIPLTVLIYQTSPNSITYYTSFFAFLLVIETSWEAIAHLHTRVTTRYAVGWTNRLVGIVFPLIRWLLKRNYAILMSEDLPMRNQRGRLRKLGYDFKMSGQVPSFVDSRKIMRQNVLTPEQNVLLPQHSPSWGSVRVDLDSFQENERRFVGPEDHSGLLLLRSKNQILVYPRLCPHEGASLDNAPSKPSNLRRDEGAPNPCTLMCPWHGRLFRPVLALNLPAQQSHHRTDWHTYRVEDGILSIESAPPTPDAPGSSDWSRPAEVLPNR